MLTKPQITTIKEFDGEILHPSLDVKDGILVIGFRYRVKAQEEQNIFLRAYKGNVEIINSDSFKLDDKTYWFEKRDRKLMRIEERWNIAELNRFLTDYSSLKKDTVPSHREVFKETVGLIKRYIELEIETDYDLLAAWILGTYFYPIFYVYPFLHIKAPKRSGKSQLLNFMRQLCFNAVKARPTLAALSDTVDSLRGTYLIDQADSLGNRGNEELLDTLADSYKRGGGKRRLMQIDKGKRQILELETYSPKVFASIKELPEDLKDRCLVIPLIRSQRNFPDPDDESGNWRQMRGKIYKLLLTDYSSIMTHYIAKKIEYRRSQEILGRSLELWLPFEVILQCFYMEEKIKEVTKRFLSQYGFSDYEPSELEEGTVKTVLSQFKDESKLILSPKEISELMETDVFLPSDTPKQRAAKVGWAIKKFNLASEKKPRTKKGICYLFEKGKVELIYDTYFKIGDELTPSTSNPETTSNNGDLRV